MELPTHFLLLYGYVVLFAWVLVMALRERGVGEARENGDGHTLPRWLIFGLLWGLIGLCNPSLLLFLPVCGVWMLLRTKDLRRSAGSPAQARVTKLSMTRLEPALSKSTSSLLPSTVTMRP